MLVAAWFCQYRLASYAFRQGPAISGTLRAVVAPRAAAARKFHDGMPCPAVQDSGWVEPTAASNLGTLMGWLGRGTENCGSTDL